jgi:tRNA A37 threonylcarbamoyladenosine synthetase subunit TsaC/SUA5/YrdC
MKDIVFLTMSDTTIGFLSFNKNKLYDIKKRDTKKQFLQVCSSFDVLKKSTRIPTKYKRTIRRSKKTTFVYPNNKAIRVSFCKKHNRFLDKYIYDVPFFSTSANISNQNFDINFALKNSNIVLYQGSILEEKISSKIYKINNNKIKLLRHNNK